MKTIPLFLILLFASQSINAQQRTFKCNQFQNALKLVDEQKYDEGILMLKECEKLDSKDYSYPYEIALSYTYKEDYNAAISQLEKIKDYENIEDDYFQLLGNNYDYSGNSEKALEVYNKGLQKFPNSGRLYLEKGVIYESNKQYKTAIEMYEKGIQVASTYPSNYYRVSKIYLNSKDKLSGLIYGEIFVNLERTTERTKEISNLLYETYKKSIVLESKEKKELNFCKVIIDTQKYEKSKKYPFCMIFGKNFIMSIIEYNKFNLNNLSAVRSRFLKEYFKEDYKNYPNVLLNYQKIMEDNKIFDAYNHYIFQMGDKEAFNTWLKTNENDYKKFVDWYTSKENILKIDNKNVFISDQIK
ncbi:tetratricopeptide repeat protein [Chryseobacterium populi]|uniref:Tetratricopeptide repeat protein n=1 Tax=Chryseobacterium populi TaxID=1144316 RepID=J2KKL5_9FLAO|nr:hypothetical protein [Chryseobacterium populi]EJL73603.1 tetratricopeptide repeat protein [Chryseobacterium populi]